ncbi:MAG TPA: tetratricopeptide repeat protein [Candidatus Wallbacteria bacterium]|nr:tetratricopeptide repeat protein [Candidatus Wallbacteria bacterium]
MKTLSLSSIFLPSVKKINMALLLIAAGFLMLPVAPSAAAGAEKISKKPQAEIESKAGSLIIKEEEDVFDESEIVESLKEIKTPARKTPRMNNPPAPPDWEGFDYDTLETNMDEVLARFKKHEQYYEPRYTHYQDDKTYKIQSVYRDKVRNLVNAKSVSQEDEELSKLLDAAGKGKDEKLGYVELLDLGIERLFKSDMKNAVRFFSQAVKTDPLQPEGYYNLALAYFYRNNVPLSIINFKRALDLKPNLAEAYNNMGVCYIRANLLERGVTLIRQANIYAPTLKEPIDNLYALKNKDLDYNYNDKLFREKHGLTSSSPSRMFSVKLKLCPPLLNLSAIEKDENRIQLETGADAYDKLVGEYRALMLESYPDIDIAIKTSFDLTNHYNKYWDALNLLKVADELYEKKLYKESERYYTQVLKMVPGVCSVHMKRANARLNVKNLRGAEYDFSFAAKNSDDDDIIREAIKNIQQIRIKKFDSF